MTDPETGQFLDAYTVEPEWVKEAETQALIPTGTYEGTILSYTAKIVDAPTSPFAGHPMIRARRELYNVEGRTRQDFFDLSPVHLAGADGRLLGPSKLFAQLAKVTGTIGKRASEVMEAATQMRVRFRVRLAPERDDETTGRTYPARNWTDAISAVKSS